jgi:outer membrane protein assembly factor BamB
MKKLLCLMLPVFLGADWPQWRGPAGDGLSQETGFALKWDAQTNVRWKVKLSGAGNASPVIAGSDLILLASTGLDHSEFLVACHDAGTGQTRWQRRLLATPADAPFKMFPPERGHAASTPIVHPNGIIAFFGTGDLFALDRAGKLLWHRALAREFGAIRNDYGLAASPLLIGNRICIQVDHLGGSYLLAIDLASGQTLWKTDRPTVYDNWATPVQARVSGQDQVVCLGTKRIQAYACVDGKETWAIDGLERLCACTPVVTGERLYAVSGPGGASIAVDLIAQPTPKVLWQSKKTGPFIPSPLVLGDWYYMVNDQGTATVLNKTSGEEKTKERVANGRMRPSPVAAAGYIYFTALDGVTTVIKAGPELEVIAKNPLGEDVAASLALANGKIYIRGEKHLWCIAGDAP